MNPVRNMAIIEAALDVAIDRAKRRGYLVLPGEWGVTTDQVEDGPVEWSAELGPAEGGCLCPMGCLIVGTQAGKLYEEPETRAAAMLQCSEEEIIQFICGVDDAEHPTHDFVGRDFYELGRKYRARIKDATL